MQQKFQSNPTIINNASLVKTLISEACDICRSLFDKDSPDFTMNQGNLIFDKGFEQ